MTRGHAARSPPPARRCAGRGGCSRAGDAPPVREWKRSRTKGVTSRPRMPAASAAARPSSQRARVQVRVHLLVERVRDDDGARGADLQPRAQHVGGLLRRVHPPWHRQPGRGQVERREGVGPVAEHGDVQRLQALERRGDVEDRLHARADDADPDAGERPEVRGLVEGLRRAAMDAAEPAGREDADARPLGEMGGRGDRRRAEAAPRASTGGRSRTPHLSTPSVFASASSASSSSPIRTSPPRIAIVAGTAPPARTTSSISRATRRLSGRGRPWAMIVLSSATTGRPSSRAVRTSS